MEAETFCFLVFFWFDDKNRGLYHININDDYGDYLFINITSGYREELL